MQFIADIVVKTMLLLSAALALEHTHLGKHPELRSVLWLGVIAGGITIPVFALLGFSFVHMQFISGAAQDLQFTVLGFSMIEVSTTFIPIWLGIAFLRMGRFLKRTADVKKQFLAGSHWLADQKTLHLVHDCTRLLGFKHRIQIRTSPAAMVPTVIGIMDPEIVVPVTFQHWESSRQHSSICHELAHIRRGDNLWSFLSALFESLYWFLPFSHVARKRIERDREFICDSIAVRTSNVTESEYAIHLLDIAERLVNSEHKIKESCVSFAALPLNQRVGMLIAAQRIKKYRRRKTPRFVSIAFAATVALLICTFSFQAAHRQSTVISNRITHPQISTPILSR